MADMTTAVCWELGSSNGNMTGLRVLLAGKFVATQELSTENERPRWKFFEYATETGATDAALAITTQFEREWAGDLIIEPGKIALHPSEAEAMANGGPISPSLRARIFTSLSRRDPRLSTVVGIPAGGAGHGE
jgi:hypothetical protein